VAGFSSSDISKLNPKEGFPYVTAKQQPFDCRLHKDGAKSMTFSVPRSVPMEYTPSVSFDTNTIKRCSRQQCVHYRDGTRRTRRRG
jgi:hypothetical protein